jgi:hypothetical protein
MAGRRAGAASLSRVLCRITGETTKTLMISASRGLAELLAMRTDTAVSKSK